MNEIKIPNPIKAVGKAVKRLMGDEEQVKEDKEYAKLESWKKKLNDAMSEHEGFRTQAAQNDAQYNGTKTVKSLNGSLPMTNRFSDDEDARQTQNARQVVNITFQLVESQITIDVPKPVLEPVEGEDSENKKMLEGSLCAIAEGPDLERLNSENERIAKKNSLATFKVIYNPDFKSHKYCGRIETTNPHPVNIIPQPNVYRIKDMDYLFHIENRTLDYICRTYGEEFRDKLEDENTEFGYLEDLSETSSLTASKGMLSVVECWHKDKDGDVCLLTWVNDVVIRDEPKFFYPRGEDGEISETETLEVETGINQETQEIITETVTVQRRIPRQFPFVVWYNIPREKKFHGKSDPEIISDQQEGIKKMLSIEEEKHIKGTTKIFVRKGAGIAGKLDNALSKIIEVDDPQADVKVVDLKTRDNSLIEMYGIYLQAAKDALGVTEASQGRSDSGSLSGRAIELLAQNTAGRVSVKVFEKHIAYTELFQLYYDFLIAYYDDPRPFRLTDAQNNPVFGVFDKSKLLKKDDSGEWYYPDWDIKIQADTGLPRDKRFILDAANNSGNRMDPIEFWMVLDSIGFPNARPILEREKQKEKAAIEAAANAPQPPGSPASPGGQPPASAAVTIDFKDLPIDGKLQAAGKAGLQLDPNILAGLPPGQQSPGQAMLQQGGQPQGPAATLSPEQMEEVFQQFPPQVQQLVMKMTPEQQQQFLSMPAEQMASAIQQIMAKIGEQPN